MAELNINGVKSGEPFWYSSIITEYDPPQVPVLISGEKIEHFATGPRFIVGDRHVWPSEVFTNQAEANQDAIRQCQREIARCKRSITECEIVLAKLMVASDEPVPVVGDIPTFDEGSLPF